MACHKTTPLNSTAWGQDHGPVSFPFKFLLRRKEIGMYRLITAAIVFFWLLAGNKASYGRYVKHDAIRLSSKLAWFVFELPGIAIPVMFLLYGACPRLEYLPNKLYFSLFVIHCFLRSLVYPLLMRSGKTMSLSVFLAVILFVTHNGYLHSAYLLYHAKFEEDWLSHANTYIGIGLFVAGMVINIHSDHILRSLRSPAEINIYKIPRGGMFEYVSGANFFGEIMEWLGFAIGTWSLPAAAFAFFVICNLGPRAFQHHRYYKEKFDDYPKDRKALIPFIA